MLIYFSQKLLSPLNTIYCQHAIRSRVTKTMVQLMLRSFRSLPEHLQRRRMTYQIDTVLILKGIEELWDPWTAVQRQDPPLLLKEHNLKRDDASDLRLINWIGKHDFPFQLYVYEWIKMGVVKFSHPPKESRGPNTLPVNAGAIGYPRTMVKSIFYVVLERKYWNVWNIR